MDVRQRQRQRQRARDRVAWRVVAGLVAVALFSVTCSAQSHDTVSCHSQGSTTTCERH